MQFNLGMLSIINSNETNEVTKTDSNGLQTKVNETKDIVNYYNNDRAFPQVKRTLTDNNGTVSKYSQFDLYIKDNS